LTFGHCLLRASLRQDVKQNRKQQEEHTAYTQFPCWPIMLALLLVSCQLLSPVRLFMIMWHFPAIVPVQLGFMAEHEDPSAPFRTLLKLGRQLNLCRPIQNNPNFAYFLFEV